MSLPKVPRLWGTFGSKVGSLVNFLWRREYRHFLLSQESKFKLFYTSRRTHLLPITNDLETKPFLMSLCSQYITSFSKTEKQSRTHCCEFTSVQSNVQSGFGSELWKVSYTNDRVHHRGSVINGINQKR